MLELFFAAALAQAEPAPMVPPERLEAIVGCLRTSACDLPASSRVLEDRGRAVTMLTIMVSNIEMVQGRREVYGYGVFTTSNGQFGVTIIDPEDNQLTIHDNDLDGWVDAYVGTQRNRPSVGGRLDRRDRNFEEFQISYYVAMGIIAARVGYPVIGSPH